MKKYFILLLFISILLTFFSTAIFALNPFVTHIYTADPSAHVFENRVYVYPSHDKDNPGFFDMQDYHVFSSADLINWVDHGVVLKNDDVKWADGNFWAPDCAYKNGKYYLYFPAHRKGKPAITPDTRNHPEYWGIGVAISNSPSGPFVPLDDCIDGSLSIDPCPFIDDDGNAYLFYGGTAGGGLARDQGPYFVKLKPNMIEFDGTPTLLTTVKNYFEGPWVHKRNGIYYLSYSDGDMIVGEGTSDKSQLSDILYSYCTTKEDFLNGTWTYPDPDPKKSDKAIIMTALAKGGDIWTNHHSIVEFKGDWYFFYQKATLSNHTFKRSICVEKLFYENDGKIKNKIPTTTEGVGTSAYSRIKAQLFSGKEGSELKTDFIQGGDIGKYVGWIRDGYSINFNNMDFGSVGATGFEAEVASGGDGGVIVIRKGSKNGNELGRLTVDNTGGWQKWVTKSILLTGGITDKNDIYLVFEKKNSNSTYLLNLNSFKFTYDYGDHIFPIGQTVALKSYCSESLDNNECQVNDSYFEGSSKGQKYLCADKYQGYDLCTNRERVGKENKFTVLSTTGFESRTSGGYPSNIVVLNSSSNGKNITLLDQNEPIKASGGDFKNVIQKDFFSWIMNDDNTIMLRNLDNNKLVVINSWTSKDPARVYCDGDGGENERFYCEVSDAPIGCTVAFKTLGYFKERINDTNYSKLGQMYLCADTWNMDALCASRSEIGYDPARGEWEKFLVVDAKNGYIALQSFNKDANNQYLRVDQNDKICKVNGGTIIDSDYERFQWINNGDGTISLRNVGLNQVLSVVNIDTNGNLKNPATIYANKSKVSNDPDSHEKFYCQIVAPTRN